MGLWSHKDILYCFYSGLSFGHTHRPCFRCAGKAVLRSTEYHHWLEFNAENALERMFRNTTVAQILQSHTSSQLQFLIFISHQPGKRHTIKNGIFKGDPRGISLALCTNGVNKVQYSMWPVKLTILNLPKRLRNRFSSIMLVGIIPSNGSHEPKSLDPFLKVLVDELIELSSCRLYYNISTVRWNCFSTF